MKKFRCFLSLLMAAVLLAGLLPADTLAAPVTYDLKIKGVQVTSENWMNVLNDGVFMYQYNARTLVIEGDCTLDDDSPVDTMIESGIDDLTINVTKPSTLTLKKSDPDSCVFRLSGDTTITKYGNTPGALTLVNEGAGGTGILADNCALTLQYVPLETRDLTYGIRGLGSGASLTIEGANVKIPRQENALPPVTPNAAVSGFMQGIELRKADLVIPENGKILDGAVCGQDNNEALDLVIQTREWDEIFATADSWELELSTLGEYNSETGKYTEYDIDLAAVFNSSEDSSKNTKWNKVDSVLIVKGSVPDGMELALGKNGSDPGSKTLLLKGRPAIPGTYELWLHLFGEGLINGGNNVISNMCVKVILTVKYESNLKLYDLWIDGIRADNAHEGDILGDGTFSYDPDTQTLSIRKDYTQSWTGNLIRSGIEGLIVDVPEDVTISAEGTVFRLEKRARFRGEGLLTVRSSNGDGIKVTDGASLNLIEALLDVEAAGTAVSGSDGGERLWLEALHLNAKGGTKAVSGFSGGITLYPSDSTLIKTPSGGKVIGGSIVKYDGSAAPEVEITTVRTYGLKIAGNTVTEDNRKDILGNGAFSFDGDKTLTVKKSFTTGSGDYYTNIIENDSVDGLIIRVATNVTLKIDPNCWGVPILTKQETTITGPGHLTLISGASSFNPALSADKDLTLKELTLTAAGYGWAIQGNGLFPNKLIVENATVMSSTDATGGNAAVSSFPNGIELKGCQITLPIDYKIKAGSIVRSDESSAREVTISPINPVNAVTLDRTSLTLPFGGSYTLTASLSPANASNKSVAWESSDPSIAAVDAAGTVTGVKDGTAVITVRTADGGKTATCAVTVTPPVHVTGVTLPDSKMTLAEGAFVFLKASVSPGNATDKTVTWQSSNPAVAAVDADGMVTGVSVGKATITVKTKDGGKTAECEFTITPAIHVTGVKLDPAVLTLPYGGSGTLKAIVSPSDATNQTVTWSSDKPSVATVSLTGKVTAVSAGTAKITATTADGGKTASCTVTVQPQIHVTDVKVNMKELTLVVGQPPFNTEWLKATVFPENASIPYVTWTSDNPAVAGVVEATGEVYAIKEGTANITVTSTDGGKTDTCKVTVINPIHVTGITIDPSEYNLVLGGSLTLSPVIQPANATNKLVIWESNKPEVAAVNSYGVVTGLGEGNAVITAETVDGSKTAVCIVTVSKVYEYDPAARAVKTYDLVTPSSPLIVASYNANGRYLRSVFFNGPSDWRMQVIKADAKYALIVWIDLATCRPKCAARKIVLS